MQASSFLLNIYHQQLLSTIIINYYQHQPLSTSTTIINQQPYQYPQHNPKTKKDLYKTATPELPFKDYVK